VSDPGYTDVGLDALRLLKVPQVATILGVSDKTVWRLVASGELPSVKIGQARRVVPEDLAAYIARLRRGASEPGAAHG
jgi:excisionase family DNA binding protein